MGFFVSRHLGLLLCNIAIIYKFKKTIRNEKWEKVEILKNQLKKHLLKLQKKKKQKRDLKKLIDNYAQGMIWVLMVVRMEDGKIKVDWLK